MKQEDRQLLLKDLCARLPFGICANLPNHHLVSHKYIIDDINIQNGWTNGLLDCVGRIQIYGAKIEDIKPYLRPLSSMTEEEVKEFYDVECIDAKVAYIKPTWNWHFTINGIDWLNANHFDYRGLIPKCLAIKAPKDMYKL